MIDGQTWPIPKGVTRMARCWRVTAPPGHPDAGLVREFKAQSVGAMGMYLEAMAWYYGRPGPGILLPIGYRLVRVGEIHLEVPVGVKRITDGWRSACGDAGVSPGKLRDFSDPSGDATRSLARAIAWQDGTLIEAPRAPAITAVTEPVPLRTRKRGGGRPLEWHPADDLILLYRLAEGPSLQHVAESLGRTVKAVTQRAARLGFGRRNPYYLDDREWTQEEDDILLAWGNELDSEFIHRVFFVFNSQIEHRSYGEVRARCRHLGVGISYAEMVDLVGEAWEENRRGRTKVQDISRRRTPPKRRPINPWTGAEDSLLREYQGRMPLREIHKRFFVSPCGLSETRSYAAVAQRIGALGISLDRHEASELSRRWALEQLSEAAERPNLLAATACSTRHLEPMGTWTMNEVLDAARDLAYRAHANQVDQASIAYVEHLERVASAVADDLEAVVVAMLHDLEEDQPGYAHELENFPERIQTALDALTRRPGVSPDAYYARIRLDPLALRVKLADIADNADEARLSTLDEAIANRLRAKYAKARAALTA
ncbi:hypothetical protein [Luteimonas sp. MHLX1A]|uniref:hypothetical protein n=1 Tax=Alterluteimonas muca TaxID=2878684 RepID=UPI001E4786B8|nr:hypothetical protein [Luteimonas sp. MHLX1A]MCD9046797.1 hypothetical protein [Luteimonas sp. MHLX1A]